MLDPVTGTQTYAVAPAIRVRLLGTGLVAVGVLVAVATLLVAYAGVPGAVLTTAVVLAALLVLLLGAALARPVWVLRTDGDGYRVRFVRGAGVASAPWRDVARLETGEVEGSRVLVLWLRDGRRTQVPVDLLGTDPEELVRTLRGRLAGRPKP